MYTDASTVEVLIHSSAEIGSDTVNLVCADVFFYWLHTKEQWFDVMSRAVAELASSLPRENALKSR